MLRKVGESAWPISEKDAVVSIKDASYPIPFPQGLEFNSPAHGCWNIVHTGIGFSPSKGTGPYIRINKK